MPAEGGFPAQLEPFARLKPGLLRQGNVALAIVTPEGESTWPGLLPGDPNWKVMELVADIPVEGGKEAALRIAGPLFEGALNIMSFIMASAIPLGRVEVIDITEPLEVGAERESQTFSSAPFDGNAQGIAMTGVSGFLECSLPPTLAQLDSRTAAALKWFVKSIETARLHDQFIFSWIALEILRSDSGVGVTAPYRANCQHEISACPLCLTPTARVLLGQSMQKFLVEIGGVSVNVAADLWRMRQMMHGAVPFDSPKLDALPSLVHPLRSAVSVALKRKLGWSDDSPPVIQQSGMVIHPSVSAYGSRHITERDVTSLDQLVAIDAGMSPQGL